METQKIRIRFLENRGIYVKGQEIDTGIRHGQQWINSGFAEFVPVAPAVGVPVEDEPKPEEKKEKVLIPDYSKMLSAELSAELDRRGLDASGNKAIKIDRLKDDDFTKSFVEDGTEEE